MQCGVLMIWALFYLIFSSQPFVHIFPFYALFRLLIFPSLLKRKMKKEWVSNISRWNETWFEMKWNIGSLETWSHHEVSLYHLRSMKSTFARFYSDIILSNCKREFLMLTWNWKRSRGSTPPLKVRWNPACLGQMASLNVEELHFSFYVFRFFIESFGWLARGFLVLWLESSASGWFSLFTSSSLLFQHW